PTSHDPRQRADAREAGARTVGEPGQGEVGELRIGRNLDIENRVREPRPAATLAAVLERDGGDLDHGLAHALRLRAARSGSSTSRRIAFATAPAATRCRTSHSSNSTTEIRILPPRGL